MPTLNLAIYGPGRWAGRLVGAIQDKSDKARFAAAASNDPARHQAFGEKFSIPVTSFDAVLADPAIDGVVLATPHSDHAAQAIAAAEAGKHVFIEKPFALTRADAEAVVAACAKAGVTVGHGFNRRFSPAFLESGGASKPANSATSSMWRDSSPALPASPSNRERGGRVAKTARPAP